MQRIFSQKLMQKAQVIFEKKCGRTLSEDEVEIMLDRLSELGILFAQNVLEGRTKIKNHEINTKEI